MKTPLYCSIQKPNFFCTHTADPGRISRTNRDNETYKTSAESTTSACVRSSGAPGASLGHGERFVPPCCRTWPRPYNGSSLRCKQALRNTVEEMISFTVSVGRRKKKKEIKRDEKAVPETVPEGPAELLEVSDVSWD